MASRPWTEEDLQVVRDNPDVPSSVLAEKLGRTCSSIVKIRWRHTPGGGKAEDWDYDTRPSGWYVEVIGTLLTHYPDAYDSWKHYHRYVEVKETGTGHSGWTYLLCRRDENAP